MKQDTDYLFDKDGEAEADVKRLEDLLGRHRWEAGETPWEEGGEVVVGPSRVRPRSIRPWLAAAAAITAVFFGLRSLMDESPAEFAEGYEVTGFKQARTLGKGQELALAETEHAQLLIDNLGRVDLEGGSILRVDERDEKLHRLYLEKGALHARIYAEPRLFQVGTPAGLTVDLGCEYSLRVDDDGSSHLAVTHGQVAFEFDGREVFVPNGASCTSLPGRGPDAPIFEDADPEFRAAVRRAEFDEQASREDIERVRSIERREDALTLWHLLDAPSGRLRKAVLDRLLTLFPLPAGVTDRGIAMGDRDMRTAWMETMKVHWHVTFYGKGGSKLDFPSEFKGAGEESKGD